MTFGAEVGGWLASACISKLVDKVCSYIADQYSYEANIKDKLKYLERDLKNILIVLHEAEKRMIENPYLQDWLWDLKEASYKAEDILDMFEYKVLEDKVEKTLNQGSSTLHRLIKRVGIVAGRFTFSDDEVKELNDVVDKFKRIITDMGHLRELINCEPLIKENEREIKRARETSSTCTEPQLFGRDKEKSYLIEQLLETDSSNNGASSSKNVHVHPVVGIGGVGKTTLVQDVYSNQKVKDHFDLRAWVCVSVDFDVKRLVKEIIESASISKPQDFHNLENLDAIQKILKTELAGKKYLIVLDDVWNEVDRKWEELQAILNFGKKGSKVVVSTRNQNIADMMGTKACISLEGLPQDDYWRFFVKCAFGDKDPRDYQILESIGRQIAEKLRGNPLAAKTVGAVLKLHLKATHWRDVLESKWWLDQHGDGIMSVLRLSFDYLPTHLKQCFIFCSLFPQDYNFKVSRLVRLWIAHGYIQSDQEEMGVKYFDELFRRSFFQKVKYSGNKYVIHDLLHDLAKKLSGGEVFDVAENKSIRDDRKRVRHVYVGANKLSLVCSNEHLKKNLRSLVVTGCRSNSLEKLKELRGLRVLILDGSRGELLSESIFAKMIHLRYLEIEGYEGWRSGNKLPKSLCMLYHLQVISVGHWSNDRTDGVLPDKINRLINLRHLDATDGVLPDKINRLINLRHLDAGTRGVAGIGTLTLLQELKFFVNEREGGFEMWQLQHMSELRVLEIRELGRVGSKEEACEAILESKKHLKELTLDWSVWGNADKDDDVLEGLRPHQNLESLTIRKYSGCRSPQWWNESWATSCSYLQKIELRGCTNWEILPPIGLLPHLKFLKLYWMTGVKRMGRELYGNRNNNNKNTSMILFPSLETLEISRMHELMEWWKVEEDEYGLFPHLSTLVINRCPKLRGGPLFLPSQLKVLYVSIGAEALDVEGEVSLQCKDVLQLIEWVPLQNLSSIEELTFRDEKMTKMGAEWEEWFQHRSSLRSLFFKDCSNLECLPSNLLSSSSSTLQMLEFFMCSKLESLPEEGLPTSLQQLDIRRYSSELAKGCSKDGREWHKISHIPNIRINGRCVQQTLPITTTTTSSSSSTVPAAAAASRLTDSLSAAAARIRVNYLAVIAGVLVLFAAWSFPSDQPLLLFGRQWSDRQTFGRLVLMTVFVVFLTSVGSILMSALAGIVAAQGAFRDPEDLFLDDQLDGGAASASTSTGSIEELNPAAIASTSHHAT